MTTVLAGILGTLAMTLFVELISFILKKPFHVVQILSRMLHFANNTKSKLKTYTLYLTALSIHYSIGILFSYAFDFLLKIDLMELDLWDAMLFGSLAGFVGILGWRIFFAIHPNPPKLILSQYLTIIWLGHLIYALGTLLTYLKFLPDPVQALILVCYRLQIS